MPSRRRCHQPFCSPPAGGAGDGPRTANRASAGRRRLRPAADRLRRAPRAASVRRNVRGRARRKWRRGRKVVCAHWQRRSANPRASRPLAPGRGGLRLLGGGFRLPPEQARQQSGLVGRFIGHRVLSCFGGAASIARDHAYGRDSVPGALSRCPDARHRQAGRASGPSGPEGAAKPSSTISTPCASVCRGAPKRRTASTGTRPAASSSAATPRHWRASASFSGRARSTRSTGPWSRAGRRTTRARSISLSPSRAGPILVE